jgi:hypothetical protein
MVVIMSKELLDKINLWSATTIGQIQRIPESHLNRLIAGQLKACIKAHGPITPDNIGSAAKRISCQLLAVVNSK